KVDAPPPSENTPEDEESESPEEIPEIEVVDEETPSSTMPAPELGEGAPTPGPHVSIVEPVIEPGESSLFTTDELEEQSEESEDQESEDETSDDDEEQDDDDETDDDSDEAETAVPPEVEPMVEDSKEESQDESEETEATDEPETIADAERDALQAIASKLSPEELKALKASMLANAIKPSEPAKDQEEPGDEE
ncbi:hypothetical protein KKG46_04470, partial [Patescibacteria group bacterium]|nr:hypothetical protein [Patescibacteria group bacterium]